MNRDNTIYIIGRIREKANKFLLKELEEIGIKDVAPSHGDILANLFKCKKATMTEIANLIHRDRSTVTTLVNKLIKLGYVLSERDINDSRSSIISLTKKGEELETAFKEISQKLYEVEYKGFTEEEKMVLKNLLNKINNNF